METTVFQPLVQAVVQKARLAIDPLSLADHTTAQHRRLIWRHAQDMQLGISRRV